MDINRITYHVKKHSSLSDALGRDYIGFVRVHHEGGTYTVRSLVRRISRGDAKQDAVRIGHDILFENFGN